MMRITRLVQRRSGDILMQNYKTISYVSGNKNVTLYQQKDQDGNSVTILVHEREIYDEDEYLINKRNAK